ncbi:MAG: DUF4435 domain-containing protein [Rikenellaceae bacterium]|nr:DUF4435 domain-containing protein [Rikenellaceae bacterium]
MTRKTKEREYRKTEWTKPDTGTALPLRLPLPRHRQLIRVFVEGYEDVAFWRGIFDDFESGIHTFEISVPPRQDLAKGKKVLLNMLERSSQNLLLCMDSDFDFLFDDTNDQSRLVNRSPYIFHTYAYATENYLCYAPSLHNVCVKATKNDTRIFDFERFMADYSRTIYPLFVRYALSAKRRSENFFPLIDFKSSVKLNYVEVEENGRSTIEWLRRQVERREQSLRSHKYVTEREVEEFRQSLADHGVTPENAYLFMHGHTLMDNVVMIVLNAVCEKLKMMTNNTITNSERKGVTLRNEMSNYNNSLRSVRDTLLFNENYKECFLYKRLKDDIEEFLKRYEFKY